MPGLGRGSTMPPQKLSSRHPVTPPCLPNLGVLAWGASELSPRRAPLMPCPSAPRRGTPLEMKTPVSPPQSECNPVGALQVGDTTGCDKRRCAPAAPTWWLSPFWG